METIKPNHSTGDSRLNRRGRLEERWVTNLYENRPRLFSAFITMEMTVTFYLLVLSLMS